MTVTDTGPFGFGPFTEGLTDSPPHPPGRGYGSLADPLSSATYGFSAYGSGAFPKPPFPVSGGYGGDPFGHGPYGASIDVDAPEVTSVLSLDGFRAEVFFSETVKLDADFFNTDSYILVPVLGAAPITVTSIGIGITSPGGANSAIMFTTGTTLGGRYELTVINVKDTSDNLIQDSPFGTNIAEFLARGSIPNVTVSPVDGQHVVVDFDQGILTEAEFSPGVEDISAYALTTTYPVTPTVTEVVHPYLSDNSQILLTVQGQTSVEYELEVGPSLAFEYTPAVLPDADSGFMGSEIGIGSSVATGTELQLTKSVTDTYGWNFAESPNVRILPGSSFRADVSLNASTAVFTPALFDASAFIAHVSDGSIQVSLVFTRVAGVDTIQMLSGNYAESAPAAWSSGFVTVSLVRNQKASSYSVVFNETPILTAPLTGAVGEFPDGPALIPAGVQTLLTSTYDVVDFPITALNFTSTQTVFTSAWNFIHGLTSPFTGSAAFALDKILTDYGPLVKDWGDTTPAEIEDVAVRVNGTDVEVGSVNPYTGEIRTVVPIPRMPTGSLEVDIDYTWFPNPVFPMVGLNTPGLVLNKHDRPRGRTATSPAGSAIGAYDETRFPYSVLLGPGLPACDPIWVGHRYIGFQKSYTASLNSPNTLLLNQRPFGASKPYALADSSTESITLELGGLSSEWEVRGDGTVEAASTEYTVTDDSDTGPAFVARVIDLSSPSTVKAATRFSTESYTLDGVWTGISFGFHDNNRLYLIGALIVNGLEHVGILLDTDDPSVASSWLIGPRAEGQVQSSTQVDFPPGSVPTGVEIGGQFQIITGPQTGIYSVSSIFFETDKTVVEINETFPADPILFGNRDVIALFENLWSGAPVTWRVEADTETQIFSLVFGGDPSGMLVFDPTLELPEPGTFASPPGLETSRSGELIWGSFSRTATSVTGWSLLRLESGPKPGTTFSRGTVENVNFFDFTEEGWFPTSPYGYSETNNDGELFLRGIAASMDRDVSFGYSQLDPFLSTDFLTVLQSRFKVRDWTSGGDASLRIVDRKRTALLSTLAFRDTGSKSLIQLPFSSLSSIASFAEQGWTPSGNLVAEFEPPFIDITKASTSNGILVSELSGGTESATGNKILTARLAVQSWTADTNGRIGLQVSVDAFADTGLEWYASTTTDPARLVLVSGLTTVATFTYDWEDAVQRTYEVRTDSGTGLATLTVDNIVIGTAPLTSFTTSGATGTQTRLLGSGSGVSFTIRLQELSATIPEPADTLRTLGVWLGGDVDDIDSWKLPRSDSGSVNNSDPGATIVEMDWSEIIEVRMHLDPTFGLVIERPDIPLPPGYIEGEHATRDTNPTRGWIVVEYRHLPFTPVQFGSVAFGPLNPESLTNQDWYSLFYRIYTDPVEDYLAPHHMVLNQWNVIASGEYEFDNEPEVVVVSSLTSTMASIRSGHQNASRVFSVIVDEAILSPDDWSFDLESQTILLVNPLASDHYPVTITFAPGKPVTSSYLQRQPFAQSVTKLNEGTPPVPKSQIAGIIRLIISGSSLNDINDVLNLDPDFLLNDPFQTVAFDEDPGVLYEDLQFFEIPDNGKTGLISTICDGPAPGEGLREIGVQGYQDRTSFLNCPDPYEGGGMMLHAAGGSPNVVGMLNTSPLIPVAPSTWGAVSGGIGRCVQRITWDIRLAGSPGSVLRGGTNFDMIDDFDIVTNLSDGFAPTGPPGLVVNPSTSEFANGAVWHRLEIVPDFSHLGPSSGMETLEVFSLLYGASAEQPQGTPESGDGLTLFGNLPLPLNGIISEGVLS